MTAKMKQQTLEKIAELRKYAKSSQTSAQYADSSQARHADLDRAKKLSAEADRLEREFKESNHD